MGRITYEVDQHQADLLEIAAHAIGASGASYVRLGGGKVVFGEPGGDELEHLEGMLPELLLANEEVVVEDLQTVEWASSRPDGSAHHAIRFVVALRVRNIAAIPTGTLLVFDAKARSAPLTERQVRILRMVARLLEA